MAEIEYSSPFLSSEDDFFDLEDVALMADVPSSARCGPSKQWLGAYPGEKVTPAPPQTSVPLDPTHSLWYESMQDMSGFVLPDSTLPPLDEQLQLNFSTAQSENDFYVQNTELPSPVEFFLGDISDGVTTEDSHMFDNSNTLDLKINECQPESPTTRNMYDYMNLDQTRTTTNMGNEEKNLSSPKTSFCRPKAKLTNIFRKEKPRYLAIIDSEEPLIKEDPDILYHTQNKMDFDIKADMDMSDIFSSEELSNNEEMDKVYCSTDFKDMGVAEEVIVTTEEENSYKNNLNVSLLDSVPFDSEEDLIIPEEKEKKESEVVFQLDPFSGLEIVMGNLFNDLDQTEDDLYSNIEDGCNVSHEITPEAIQEDHRVRHSGSPVNNLFSSSINNKMPPSSDLLNDTSHQETKKGLFSRNTNFRIPPKHVPLTLDIDAARDVLMVDKEMSDTPELLEVLKPEVGKFDLIEYIEKDGNLNKYAISPMVESCPKKLEAPRKGKSHLSLLDLKEAQKMGRGKPLSRLESETKENEPLPSTSGTFPPRRPARQSATRFKKMLEEGLLSSVVDSRSVSSDDEDIGPKAKRRRTTSITSSQRQLNSDSDRSSISEEAMKYRERRDRNNLSSKRSRHKRKLQHLMQQEELQELEDKNVRLKLKAKELESLLTRVKAAWADYLAHMKGNNKDRR